MTPSNKDQEEHLKTLLFAKVPGNAEPFLLSPQEGSKSHDLNISIDMVSSSLESSKSLIMNLSFI